LDLRGFGIAGLSRDGFGAGGAKRGVRCGVGRHCVRRVFDYRIFGYRIFDYRVFGYCIFG